MKRIGEDLRHGRAATGEAAAIVAVRFNYRSKDIRHLKPNWFYGSIWSQRRAEGKVLFDSIPAMVATGDVASFKAVSTKPQSVPARASPPKRSAAV